MQGPTLRILSCDPLSPSLAPRHSLVSSSQKPPPIDCFPRDTHDHLLFHTTRLPPIQQSSVSASRNAMPAGACKCDAARTRVLVDLASHAIRDLLLLLSLLVDDVAVAGFPGDSCCSSLACLSD